MSENLELQISVKGADKSEKALSSLEKTLISIDTTLSKLNTSSFDSLANSLNKLNGIKISSTVGKNINVISEALSKLETDGGNFDKLADGISKLNGVKVSKTIGTGLESITNSLNNISKVKPINPQLATNLDILGRSMQGFVGLNGIQFTGIAKLTSTLAQTGKVKAFDDKIIRNAEKLGKAINKLDSTVTASNPRLEALAKVTKQIAPAMREADKGTASFGKSLRLLNFEAVLKILDRAVNKLKEFTLMLKGIAFESAGLENAMSFFNQSLGTYARREMEILNKYAQIGAIDLKDATQQIAGMNQMLIGYGHNADNAAKMSRVLYQIAVDASFAIGENGRDVADKMKQLESAMAGLPKSLYGWGVDTSVANIIENFDEATRGMNKFTKSIYSYQMILASTRGMQGQFAREFALATTQMYMLENQTKMTVQAIGFAIKPMFLQIVKWAFVTLRVIELVIEALSRLFGFDYQKVDYMTLLNGMNEVTSASDNIGAGAVDNLDKAQKEAKKLKKYLAGFDTLNVMEIPTSSGSAVGGAIGGGIGSFVPEDYDLLGGLGDEMENYFKELDAQAEKVFETLKKILPIATAIGAALLAWKLATALAFGLNNILELLGRIKGMALPSINLGAMFVGIGLFMDAISKIKKAVKDIIDNGANFDNVTLLLEGLTEGLGAFFLTIGNFKIGGALLVISGVIGIIQDIKSIASEGANFDNVMSLIDHFGIVLIGIGAFTGNKTIFGVGAIIKGAADVIQAIKDIQENGFTKSNVWELIQGALIGLGGVLVTLGGLKMSGGITTVLSTITTTLAGISAPVVAIIAAIGTLIAAFATLWKTNEEFKEKMANIWGQIKNTISNYVDEVKQRFEGLGISLEGLSISFKGIIETLKNIWIGFSNLLAPIFEGVFQQIANTLDLVLGAMINILDIFIGIFTGNWEQLWNGLTGLFSTAWDFIVSTLTNGVEILTGLLDVFLGWFGTTWENVWSNTKQFFTDTWSGMMDFFKNAIKTITEGVSEWSTNMVSKAKEMASKFLENVVEFFTDLPYKVVVFSIGVHCTSVVLWTN